MEKGESSVLTLACLAYPHMLTHVHNIILVHLMLQNADGVLDKLCVFSADENHITAHNNCPRIAGHHDFFLHVYKYTNSAHVISITCHRKNSLSLVRAAPLSLIL